MVEVAVPEPSHVICDGDAMSSSASAARPQGIEALLGALMPQGYTCLAGQRGRAHRWYCQLCGNTVPPYTKSRHHCRTCGRTICDGCSVLPPGSDRICHDCSKKKKPREKYVFLVRHAQSKWNQNVDLMKKISSGDFDLNYLQNQAARLPHMAKEVLHTDHPISEQGRKQTEILRDKIAAERQNHAVHCADNLSDIGTRADSSSSSSGRARTPHEKQYYDRFLTEKKHIYCSPLLRALQTAHLALPADAGWGDIKLLKDAREHFKLRCERDCLGATGIVGAQISHRAMKEGNLSGLDSRVDASDCQEQWWSDEPETDAEIELRLKSLWRRLLEDQDDSCVLVTHSNLIKALLMHVGSVDEDENEQAGIDLGSHIMSRNAGQCLQDPARSSRDADGRADSWNKVETDADETEKASSWEVSLESEKASSWEVVANSEALRQFKTDRLQNCGVLGLRCVLESPLPNRYREVDGWVDLQSGDSAPTQQLSEPRWVARDALLMFDSVLVK